MPRAVRDLLHMERSRTSYDEPDRMPDNISVSNFDILLYVVAIIGHFIDLGFDINIAMRYFFADEMMEFGWTLGFILMPAFVNTAVSIRMYAQDKQLEPKSVSNEFTRRKWLRVFILALQLAPILRFVDALIYAVKAQRAERKNDRATQRLYYELMLKEDSDAALLRIFECFLEAAPQLVLQASLLLTHHERFTVHQVLSMASSLIGMSWCLAAYQRAVRFAQADKDNISWCGTSLQVVYHYLLTFSRVTSICLVVYMFPYWAVLACAVHILIMAAWIQVFEHPKFCSHNKMAELAFSFALGAVYLFTYILAVEGKTRYRYSVYYSLCFLQNIVCGSLWYFYAPDDAREAIYFLPLLCLTVVPYVAGLVILVVYYAFFHPTMMAVADVLVSYKNGEVDSQLR